MDRLDALNHLLHLITTRDAPLEWADAYAAMLPRLDTTIYPVDVDLFLRAGHDDLNAAQSLRASVLPNWGLHHLGGRYGGLCEADLMELGEDGLHDPTRGDLRAIGYSFAGLSQAWRIAILKAMIAVEERGKDPR